MVEQGAGLGPGEDVGVAVEGEAVGLPAADHLHRAGHADEVELDPVVAGAFVAAAVACQAVDQEVGGVARAVEGVVHHVGGVGGRACVVVQDQGAGHGRGLVEALVAPDGPAQEAPQAGAEEVVFDVGAEVAGVGDGHALAAQEGDEVGVFPQVIVEGVVGQDRGLQAEGLPDQVRDHAAGLPGVVGVPAPDGGVKEAVGAVFVVRVLVREAGEEDGPLSGEGPVAGEEVGLGEGAEGRDGDGAVSLMGVLPQEVVAPALVLAAVAVVGELAGGQVAAEIVVARIPLAAEHALDLVGVGDGVHEPGVEAVLLADLQAVDGADGHGLVGVDAGDAGGRLEGPYEVVGLPGVVPRGDVGPADDVAVRLPVHDAAEDLLGPGVAADVAAAGLDPVGRVEGGAGLDGGADVRG